MALPKRRTPKAKQRHRRSHHRINAPHLVRCATCDAWQRSHHVCEACEDGYNDAAAPVPAAEDEDAE
ncbi:MAG: 50S ribosomal protein L32 [Chloroflexi bacterium]|nr:50S ribosomal protein L32 [Chloroflexota bacterium]